MGGAYVPAQFWGAWKAAPSRARTHVSYSRAHAESLQHTLGRSLTPGSGARLLARMRSDSLAHGFAPTSDPDPVRCRRARTQTHSRSDSRALRLTTPQIRAPMATAMQQARRPRSRRAAREFEKGESQGLWRGLVREARIRDALLLPICRHSAWHLRAATDREPNRCGKVRFYEYQIPLPRAAVDN